MRIYCMNIEKRSNRLNLLFFLTMSYSRIFRADKIYNFGEIQKQDGLFGFFVVLCYFDIVLYI